MKQSSCMPADRLPIVNLHEQEFTPATYNNPELTRKIWGSLQRALGAERVVRKEPVMGAEDFGRFNLEGTIPSCMIWLGAVEPEKVEKSRKDGSTLPSLHSALFGRWQSRQ